jgi:N-acetylmuramoyl-L-alanine amidase
LRFGSQGELVKKLQKALQSKSFYEGEIDGDFGERTLRAVLKFQTSSFGPNADDGIVGPQTASVLKLSWPSL